MAETSKGAVYSKQKQRRGYESIRAIDPHDGGEWDVLVPHKLMAWVASEGMGKTRELTDTVRWSLLNPRFLFRGVRDIERDIEDDDWLCYVAIPPRAYDYKTGNRVPAWANEVFLVFVTDERVLYGWAWVKSDLQQARLPIDHEYRFREKVF